MILTKDASESEKIKDITIQTLEIEASFARGFYPKPGRCMGLLHDYAYTEKKIEKVVTLGLMLDGIIIRASPESGFSVNELVNHLQKTMPKAFVEEEEKEEYDLFSFPPIGQKDILPGGVPAHAN